MATLLSATHLRNKTLDALFGWQNYGPSFNSVYLGLSTTTPTYNASGDITGVTEPTDARYARKKLSHYGTSLENLIGQASVGQSTNTVEFHFEQASEASEGGTGWGTITHWVLYSAATSGNIIAAGALTNSISVSAGMVVVIRQGDMVVDFEGGN